MLFFLSPFPLFSYVFSLLNLFSQYTKIKRVCLINYAFESVVSELRRNISRSDPHYNSYISRVHDSLLRRALRGEQYLKLYSYHYLINGFAVFVTPQQVKYQTCISKFHHHQDQCHHYYDRHTHHSKCWCCTDDYFLAFYWQKSSLYMIAILFFKLAWAISLTEMQSFPLKTLLFSKK